jgi:hypothetical protein
VAAQDVWAEAYSDKIDTQVFIDTVKDNTPFPRSLDTAVWQTIATTEFTRAWNGDVSVGEAAKSVAQQMNDALAAEQG